MPSDLSLEAFALLRLIKSPLRWPTVKWLLSDVFDITDHAATQLIDELLTAGLLVQENGGWLRIL